MNDPYLSVGAITGIAVLVVIFALVFIGLVSLWRRRTAKSNNNKAKVSQIEPDNSIDLKQLDMPSDMVNSNLS